jgi:succinyl-diaminopimelate desuccinylase
MTSTTKTAGDDFDPVAFLQRLVAMETCDPPGREIEIATVVLDELRAWGIEAEIDEFAPGRANVLGRVPGAGAKPPLVLSAHLDTVPVGAVPWSFPPFSGAIRDGRVLGRGTADMKSAVAAMIATAVELTKRSTPLAGDVLLAFSAGESSNCLGAKRFVERGFQKRIGALLIGEPSSLDVIVAEKAALWLRATARGRSGHVSGDPGVNAIRVMIDYLNGLDALALPAPEHPLLDGPTLRVGTISGGSAVNVTPDTCTAEIDVRLAPGIEPK